MAISASAINLAQYALMSNSPLVREVVFSLIENGDVRQDIPFVSRASLLASGVRWEGNLPTVTWANINDEGTTTSGTPTPYQEQAFVMRNNIDVDHLLVEDENQIVDPRGVQVEAYLRSAVYDFNDKFINNNHVTGNAKAPVGLRYRIDNPTIFGVRSANKISGSAVDITPSGATAVTFGAFIELLDQLLWSVDSPEGVGVSLYMNSALHRRINRLAATFSGQGGFGQATDQLGRTVATYKSARIREIGLKSDQSTEIITSTEDTAGLDASSTYTSVYAVRYDLSHCFGWQYGALDAKDLGLMENGVIYRTFIEWAGGLMMASNRSIARLYDIKYA
jgi:hypothetical protein